MSAYIVVRIGAVHDVTRYDEYRSQTPALLARHGARYLVKGYDEELVEGSSPERFTLIEFPSLEAIRRFWDSEEYAWIRELRLGAVELKVGFLDDLQS